MTGGSGEGGWVRVAAMGAARGSGLASSELEGRARDVACDIEEPLLPGLARTTSGAFALACVCLMALLGLWRARRSAQSPAVVDWSGGLASVELAAAGGAGPPGPVPRLKSSPF